MTYVHSADSVDTQQTSHPSSNTLNAMPIPTTSAGFHQRSASTPATISDEERTIDNDRATVRVTKAKTEVKAPTGEMEAKVPIMYLFFLLC